MAYATQMEAARNSVITKEMEAAAAISRAVPQSSAAAGMPETEAA